ncbi:PREDICTED: uncharacterized protein LOC106330138 [Brassica oleracea var. oleracea]|uniref:uncharacterized protein LOC106330138 n=1 Tax=Brassica oleracea var. oleracea TaxID=109376 RepID=UPI0006A72940|nr:PREDICTED: uncharacterized protein LOC106330138 [Brassica oleracea var. oleracea]
MGTPYNFRSWLDQPHMDPNTNLLTEEYARGIQEFMGVVQSQPEARTSKYLLCPCSTCKNNIRVKKMEVWSHLYLKGFTRGYKIWYLHGERFEYGSSSEPQTADRLDEPTTDVDFGIGTVQMVYDAYGENLPSGEEEGDRQEQPNVENFPCEEEGEREQPNLEARRFFEMLDAAKQPLYQGCKDGHSPLSSASRLMALKTDYNLAEECVDAIADFVKDVLPEDNLAPGSYYEVQKLVAGLGLPYQVIDVCIDNCMIYWRADENRERCKFCRKPRYQDTTGRVPVPYKRMWYLPLTERLKRLYQSERTAEPMRWHAEHLTNGEITHPSDAEAWKHFQSTYPEFASEVRNVYLALCTDGFSPFGKHGRQYSLWPVILTPYNLPPHLCMRREFLFLSILVPGPDHPKRSLDVFLQPLIYELQLLWEHGVHTYDVSRKENFQMRAVLMWTISDFPAYGMLSGWTTHGRLSCPYCQDNTDAFQLKNGRKTCWFDCHRRFLPHDHPYRKSKTLFTKNKRVFDSPPEEVSGKKLKEQLRDFGADRTPDVGGNGHEPIYGVGENHNWHKKSIFWDLPYWETHLLRHCLDVMHIEKNFFDNLMNTILDVQGKTKDNLKSRLDLVDICARPELHVDEHGKGPIPIYRLDATAKEEFFDWITHSVKFPDGYASSLRNCVDKSEGKFTGLKSHDCHVMMQRLLPFAFSALLPRNVHEATAGISAFFRDLCSRSLTSDGIRNLEVKIPVILCNLEKIFPPSFFDVMEHLAIHLAREAALGGPVQYRWMYLYERFMFHLKKKVKNLSKVEGSIVAQCINEETSNFAEYYFPSEVRTKSRRPARHDDRGERATYYVYVPNMFTQIGRHSGKSTDRILTVAEHAHLHTYLLTNCEDILEYESIYLAEMRLKYPDATEEQLEQLKQNNFATWLSDYVSHCLAIGHPPKDWLREIVCGPKFVAKSYPRYCTRGYAFRVLKENTVRRTIDCGVSSSSGDDVSSSPPIRSL